MRSHTVFKEMRTCGRLVVRLCTNWADVLLGGWVSVPTRGLQTAVWLATACSGSLRRTNKALESLLHSMLHSQAGRGSGYVRAAGDGVGGGDCGGRAGHAGCARRQRWGCGCGAGGAERSAMMRFATSSVFAKERPPSSTTQMLEYASVRTTCMFSKDCPGSGAVAPKWGLGSRLLTRPRAAGLQLQPPRRPTPHLQQTCARSALPQSIRGDARGDGNQAAWTRLAYRSRNRTRILQQRPGSCTAAPPARPRPARPKPRPAHSRVSLRWRCRVMTAAAVWDHDGRFSRLCL